MTRNCNIKEKLKELRQLFCWHKWEISRYYQYSFFAGHETYRKDVCKKCGKINVDYIDDEI